MPGLTGALDNPQCGRLPRRLPFANQVDQFERDKTAAENKQTNPLERIQVSSKKKHSCRNGRVVMRPFVMKREIRTEKNGGYTDTTAN